MDGSVQKQYNFQLLIPVSDLGILNKSDFNRKPIKYGVYLDLNPFTKYKIKIRLYNTDHVQHVAVSELTHRHCFGTAGSGMLA